MPVLFYARVKILVIDAKFGRVPITLVSDPDGET